MKWEHIFCHPRSATVKRTCEINIYSSTISNINDTQRRRNIAVRCLAACLWFLLRFDVDNENTLLTKKNLGIRHVDITLCTFVLKQQLFCFFACPEKYHFRYTFNFFCNKVYHDILKIVWHEWIWVTLIRICWCHENEWLHILQTF